MMVFSDWKRAKNFSHKWRTEKVPIHRDLEILKISVLDIFPIRVPYAGQSHWRLRNTNAHSSSIDAPARRFRVSSARWHRVVTALLVRPLATRAAREWDAWTRTSAEAYSGGVRRLELDRAWRRRRCPARDEVGTSEVV
jgi:hypothetical protein